MEAIFAAMFRAHPIYRLARVLFLAAAGFVLFASTAVAHERHTATNTTENYGMPAVTVAHSSGDRAVSGLPADMDVQADYASHSSTPCSDDHAGGHFSGTCCTIACHAALAASPIGVIGSSELPTPSIVALVDMLEGQSSDRTERPPKLA